MKGPPAVTLVMLMSLVVMRAPGASGGPNEDGIFISGHRVFQICWNKHDTANRIDLGILLIIIKADL